MSVGEGEETKGDHIAVFVPEKRGKRGIYTETRKQGEPNHDSVIFQPEEASQRITARAPFPLSARELRGRISHEYKSSVFLFFF